MVLPGTAAKLGKMKRIVVGLPSEILEALDGFSSQSNQPRAALIREACCHYIQERRREFLRERMVLGYQEMADLNLLLAEEGTLCDGLEEGAGEAAEENLGGSA